MICNQFRYIHSIYDVLFKMNSDWICMHMLLPRELSLLLSLPGKHSSVCLSMGSGCLHWEVIISQVQPQVCDLCTTFSTLFTTQGQFDWLFLCDIHIHWNNSLIEWDLNCFPFKIIIDVPLSWLCCVKN